MIVDDAIVLPPSAVADAKTHLRLAGSDEDALIAALLRTATALCEQFSGQALISRGFGELLPASAGWIRLGRTPVRAIATVEAIDAAGEALMLAADAYAVDIDANGDGWVRSPGGIKIRVGYSAGIADDWEALPDALRQGIVRLAAHLFTHRDAAAVGGPPAAVTALWRPWRRLRLG